MSEVRNRLEAERIRELEARQKGQQPAKLKSEEPVKFRDYSKQDAADSAIRPPAGLRTNPRGRMNHQTSALATNDDVMARWNQSVTEEQARGRLAQKAADKRRAEADQIRRAEAAERERLAKVKAWYAEQEALKVERRRKEQGVFVELQFIQSEIESTMEGAAVTKAEYDAVRRNDGTHQLPSMWLYELHNLRKSKE